jgi:hypothetical protein
MQPEQISAYQRRDDVRDSPDQNAPDKEQKDNTGYWSEAAITTPPATISRPPNRTDVDGGCLNPSHDTNWAITKKNVTYSPRSFPKSQAGAFTTHR